MRKKQKNRLREEHLLKAGICFEALEPRLLLSGSWGAGVDASPAESQANAPGGFGQETVALHADAGLSDPQSWQQQRLQIIGRVDLLANASVLNVFPAGEALEETDHGAAPADLASSTAAVRSQELVFVDAGIQNYAQLVDDILANADNDRSFEVIILEADRDGVDQISQALADRQDLDAVHFVTHGKDGGVKLGTTWLESENMDAYAGDIAGWQAALTPQADLLFYGCDLAAGDEGQTLIGKLSSLTGADVAASDDLTGSARMGGDWVLEYSKGDIETRLATSPKAPQHWSGVLATFTVTNTNDSGAGSLREAITNANANAEADVINLPAGTYTLSSGELEITSEVAITGAGAGTTFIDGNGDSRVFHLTSNTANLTLTDLTVQGGDTTGSGGGIFVHDVSAQLTATRVVVTGNIAGDGAGIYNHGTITLTDVEVSNNGDAGAGGTFEGGGIYNRNEATLNGVTLSGNRSELGGGIHNNQTSTGLSLTNVTVSGNTASSVGGGLHNQADATIVNSTFSLNDANDGGGIANIEDTLSMTNVTVSGNTANLVGGGLINFNLAQATIVNCTFTLNDANNGGGISNSGGTVNIQNTIVAGNTGANPDVESLFTSLGFNLIGNKDGSNGFTDGVLGDQVGTTGSPINPLLGALQDNGGFTHTHVLLATSPAIDPVGLSNAPTTDQRGFLRGDGSPDIGAYEFGADAASSAHYLDRFDTAGSFAGDDGTLSWSNEWQEVGESGGAGGGDVRVNDEFFGDGGGNTELLVKLDKGVWREADLSGATSATLSFDYARAGLEADDHFVVYVQTAGMTGGEVFAGAPDTWDEIGRYSGIADDVAYLSDTIDISGYIAADTRIMFLAEGATQGNDIIFVDNVKISLSTTATTTIRQETSGDLDHSQRAVAMAADGSYVVVWSSDGQDASGWGVYAQRFDSLGNPLTGEILVNETETANERWARVASDGDGNFVVTWTTDFGPSEGVYARRFDSSGTALGGEFNVNTTAFGNQQDSSVATDAAGNFIIVWEGTGTGDADGVFYRRFNADGTPRDAFERRANLSDNGIERDASVAMNAAGDFVVAWEEGGRIKFQMFASDGTPGAADEVYTNTVSSNPDVAMDALGNFVVVYRWDGPSGQGIWGHKFNSSGAEVGAWWRVGPGNLVANKDHANPSISMDDAGNFIVTYQTTEDGVSGLDVIAERFQADTTSLGRFVVNANSSGDQHMASVDMLDLDHFAVAYTSEHTGQPQVVVNPFGSAPANNVPVAAADSFTVDEGSTTTLDLAANDSDADDGLNLASIVIVSAPANGSLVVNPDGTVDYTHDGTETTVDSFTYTIEDNSGATSNAVTVSLTITPVNDAPTATNMDVTVLYVEDTPLDLTDITISDVDSPNVTATLTLSDLSAGVLSTATSGSVTSTFVAGVWTASGAIADVNTLLSGVFFTPALNYNSPFSMFTSVDDGVAAPITNVITVNSTPVNDAPTASNLSAAETYTEDTALNLTDIVVSDVDSATVTVTLTLSDVAAGTLNTATSGAVTSTFAGGVWTASGVIADVNILLAGLTFTPSSNYDSNFTIATSVDDGVAPAVTGSKAMTATAVNDAPTASNLSSTSTYNEGEASVAITDIVVSDADTGETITATLTLADTSTGSLSANNGATYSAGTGVWTITDTVANVNLALANLVFTPTVNNDVDTTISVSIDDGDEDNSGPLIGTITLDVTPANIAPVAVDDSFTVNEGSTISLNLAANDSDADDGLDLTSITIVSGPTNGTIVVNADGAVDYTHDGSETTADNFTYTINDLAGSTSNTATVDLTVTPVNDAPKISLINTTTTIAEDVDLSAAIKVADIVIADDAMGTNDISLNGADAAMFEIVGGNELYLRAGVLLDAVGNPNLDVAVAVNDTAVGGVPDDTAFQTISVTAAVAVTPPPTTTVVDDPTDSGDSVAPDPDTPVETIEPTVEPEAEPVETASEAAAPPVTVVDVQAPVSPTHSFVAARTPYLIKATTQLTRVLATDPTVKAIVQRLSSKPSVSREVASADKGPQQAEDQADLRRQMAARAYLNMVNSLDEVKKEMAGEIAFNQTVLGSAIAVSTGLSVGYVVWLIRGGMLLSSLLSSIPAWQILDPLPVLARKRNEDQADDDESLEGIIDRDQRKREPHKRSADKSSDAGQENDKV